jgi:hypothetical protein
LSRYNKNGCKVHVLKYPFNTLSVVLYVLKTSSLTVREFENRLLGRIFGNNEGKLTAECRNRMIWIFIIYIFQQILLHHYTEKNEIGENVTSLRHGTFQ